METRVSVSGGKKVADADGRIDWILGKDAGSFRVGFYSMFVTTGA